MSIEEQIDFLNKDSIYEEGIYDFRKIYFNKKKILFRCLDSYSKKHPDIDYKKLLQIFYNQIGFGNYIEHNMNMYINIDELDQNFIDNFTYLMLHNKSIKNIDDVINWTNKNKNLCDQLYKENNESFLYSFKYNNDYLEFNNIVDYLKCLIFIKKYGVDIKFVNEFLYAFADDIDSLCMPEITMLFNDLKNINNVNEADELKKIYEGVKETNYLDFFNLENLLSKSFSKIYLDSCYKPNEDDFVSELKGVKIYEAPDECFMFVHVLGGFFLNKISTENGYANDWISRKENYISMSAIGTEFSETCNIQDVCYGFYSFQPNDILGSSAKNLGIHQYTSDEDIFYPNSSVSLFGQAKGDDKYCLPHHLLIESKKVCNMDSHIHENEVAYKRFNSNGEEIKPDYIVYFSDTKDELLLEKSIVAAKEFDIPIVMVSKEKWLNYNMNKENADKLRR